MSRRVADRSVAEIVADNLRRAVRAIERSVRVVAESMRLVGHAQRERSPSRAAEPRAMEIPADVVWSNPEGTIVCRLITRRPFIHELEVSVHGDVLGTFVFDDPVEAADEAVRLRYLFLESNRRDDVTPYQ